MTSTTWIALGVAVIALVIYLMVLRGFYVQSREMDKRIDYSKIKEVTDEDDWRR